MPTNQPRVLRMEPVRVTIGDSTPVEIPAHIGKYEFLGIIGKGSFSCVVLVINRATQQKYACKVVSRDMLVQYNIFDRFEREVRIMQTMKHPSIVELVEIVYEEDLIYVVMEYCSNGELFTMISTGGKIEEYLVKRMFHQIVEGVAYIHSRNIAHRDLKPENILLDDTLNAKIADFGLCHQVDADNLMRTPCGSPFYAPPEVLQGKPYDGKKGDVWSLGVVLFAMVTGSLPWMEVNQAKLIQRIVAADYWVPGHVTKMVKDLIRGMLNPDPGQRLSIEEVSKSPWLLEARSARVAIDSAEALTARCLIKKPTWQRQVIVRPKGVQFVKNEKMAHLIRKTPHIPKKQTTSMLLPTLRPTFD